MWAGQRGMVRNFTVLLRIIYNLKGMELLFLEFSILYFQTVVDRGQPKPQKAKLWIRETPVYRPTNIGDNYFST